MLSQDSEPKRITRLLFASGCQKKKWSELCVTRRCYKQRRRRLSSATLCRPFSQRRRFSCFVPLIPLFEREVRGLAPMTVSLHEPHHGWEGLTRWGWRKRSNWNLKLIRDVCMEVVLTWLQPLGLLGFYCARLINKPWIDMKITRLDLNRSTWFRHCSIITDNATFLPCSQELIGSHQWLHRHSSSFLSSCGIIRPKCLFAYHFFQTHFCFLLVSLATTVQRAPLDSASLADPLAFLAQTLSLSLCVLEIS